jgi:Caspase domain
VISPPDTLKSRAVLIGVGNYSQLEKVGAVRNNLSDLAKAFRTKSIWGLPPGHCVVVRNPATTPKMLDPIVDAARDATDTLLLYYVGHGLIHSSSGELHLSLAGSELDPQRIYSAVPYSQVRDALESRATRRVVILDCCYSGRALGQLSDPDSTVVNQVIAEGTFVMTASAENRTALAPSGEKHTAFTGELLRIVQNGIPGRGELLDLDTIYQQLEDTMLENKLPKPQKGSRNSIGKLTIIRNRAYKSGSAAVDDADTKSAGEDLRAGSNSVTALRSPPLQVVITPQQHDDRLSLKVVNRGDDAQFSAEVISILDNKGGKTIEPQQWPIPWANHAVAPAQIPSLGKADLDFARYNWQTLESTRLKILMQLLQNKPTGAPRSRTLGPYDMEFSTLPDPIGVNFITRNADPDRLIFTVTIRITRKEPPGHADWVFAVGAPSQTRNAICDRVATPGT